MTDDAVTLTPWYLVRHAPVAGEKKGLYPDADMDAELPAPQAIKALAAALPENAIWHVSPLARTRQTAKALRAQMEHPGELSYTEEIREQNFGKWQGLDAAELWQQISNLPPHNWAWLAADTRPPGGESFCDVVDRAKTFLGATMEREPEHPRVLVTHAGLIRAFVGIALGLDAERSAALGVSPFSLTHLLHQTGPGTGRGRGGPWQLIFLNKAVSKD